MNLSHFNKKPLEQRADIILKHGVYLAVRYRSQYIIRLYYVGQSFAEVWYEPRRDRFVLVRILSNQVGLQPYLEMVDISDIYQE
ncbi:hypothetical protein [Pontibacter actiniarum]|uniref:Uncharacterized protein n=1 Tax=Pontibacter actiniarum TaxID=323450 RepID=A0A1X9YU83_9BACT|nr:hypothetical protein [Pontibacter actiniarum]ARS36437.1 hypothetical protein CA264_13880 [Pontibacter actiniarum]